MALQCLADEEALDFLQWQVLQSRARPRHRPEAEVPPSDGPPLGHPHRWLQRVVKLAAVAGPRVSLERLARLRLEADQGLAVARRIATEEVVGQGADVLPPLAERGQPDLDRVQPEQ